MKGHNSTLNQVRDILYSVNSLNDMERFNLIILENLENILSRAKNTSWHLGAIEQARNRRLKHLKVQRDLTLNPTGKNMGSVHPLDEVNM